VIELDELLKLINTVYSKAKTETIPRYLASKILDCKCYKKTFMQGLPSINSLDFGGLLPFRSLADIENGFIFGEMFSCSRTAVKEGVGNSIGFFGGPLSAEINKYRKDNSIVGGRRIKVDSEAKRPLVPGEKQNLGVALGLNIINHLNTQALVRQLTGLINAYEQNKSYSEKTVASLVYILMSHRNPCLWAFYSLEYAAADCGISFLAFQSIMKKEAFFSVEPETHNGRSCLSVQLLLGLTKITPVMVPLAGKVHSFANNQQSGDYGPTIILQHELSGQLFYTLYGHLATTSLDNIQIGQTLSAGEVFAWVGSEMENGFWVPHLHFQIIIDDYKGDYPGACNAQDKDYYLQNCPNPNLILGIKTLP
jgi:hypothetical protein